MLQSVGLQGQTGLKSNNCVPSAAVGTAFIAVNEADPPLSQSFCFHWRASILVGQKRNRHAMSVVVKLRKK